MPGVKCVKYIYFKWFSKTKNNIMITKINNIGDSVCHQRLSLLKNMSAQLPKMVTLDVTRAQHEDLRLNRDSAISQTHKQSLR